MDGAERAGKCEFVTSVEGGLTHSRCFRTVTAPDMNLQKTEFQNAANVASRTCTAHSGADRATCEAAGGSDFEDDASEAQVEQGGAVDAGRRIPNLSPKRPPPKTRETNSRHFYDLSRKFEKIQNGGAPNMANPNFSILDAKRV